jgi:hypothetical protein
MGTGIRISSTETYDKKNEKVYNGLQSTFFSSDFSDDMAFAERYSCKCKKYIGKMYHGMMCESCNTSVDFNDTDLSKTGWIVLDHFAIMSPIYAAKLADALGTADGEKIFNKIIEVDYDDVGSTKFSDKDTNLAKKHPYIHKGMIWLQENMMEVLDFYEKRKPTKYKIFKELKDDIGILFTSSIPVYSSVLRTELPGVKGNKLFKLKINTIFQSIIRIVNFINKYPLSEIDSHKINSINIQLADIQGYMLDIFDETYKELSGKKGIVLGKVMGGRYNYSARNIIVPSSGRLRADEIELGYLTFMELFRPEIINFYAKLQGCTIMEASNVWKKGLVHYNPTIYKIMQHMTTDPECKKYTNVLIN